MDGFQVVCFAVGPYRCALDILRVREIIEPSTPPSPMPGTAASVEGVIELRGAFLPVVDLRRRLGAPPGAPGKYVIAQPGADAGSRVALIVDQVHDVRRWARDQLAPPPTLGGGPPCVAGVIKQGDEVVLLPGLA